MGAYNAGGGGGGAYNDYRGTDAVTLTGAGDGDAGDVSWQSQGYQQDLSSQDLPAGEQGQDGGDGSGGKMQKVGDRWVFVRGA